jgi:outer membrane protein assembly factor BamB
VADGKLYIGGEGGTFTILAASKEMKLVGKVDFLTTPIYSSAVVANGVLYIATANNLYAIQGGAKP